MGVISQITKRLINSAEHFSPRELTMFAEQGTKSRSLLVNMPIDDFLKMARPGYDQFKADKVKELLDGGKQFNGVASLIADNEGDFLKIIGHEGRHRARELKSRGYDALPVELLVRDGGKGGTIRWGQQLDPQKLDYKEQFPTRMVSELGGKSIEFPVTRERAVSKFDPNVLWSGLLPILAGTNGE